jgi:hypothetical protein
MKTYRGALIALRNWLIDRRPFAFARFGDGELRILKKQRNPYAEFKYNPADPADDFFRERLLDAFRYRDPVYHVGIPCPKCVGMEKFLWAKRTSGQPEAQLTYAALLVNSNYEYFIEQVVPVFGQYQVMIVCNRLAALDRLPFAVARDFRVGFNAWRDNYHLAAQIAGYVARENVRGALFLLCAGPFSNILAQTLHAHRADSTYLDIGSTLDPFLFGQRGRTRRYLRGEKRLLNEVCVWA